MLGNLLVTAPFEEGETCLPTPNQLKYKIIIKNKKLPTVGQSASNIDTAEDVDSDFEDEPFVNDLSSGENKNPNYYHNRMHQMMKLRKKMRYHYLWNFIT